MNVGRLSIMESKFESNLAMFKGGGISLTGAHVTITLSLFEGNNVQSAEGVGGAINVENAGATMKNVLVKKNRATFRGGFFLLESQVNVLNSTFESNLAGLDSGSGIWISTATNFTISQIFFRNNEAPKGTGVIYWEYSPTIGAGPSSLTLNTYANNRIEMVLLLH